ncbi:MAG: hypothetical protein OXH34_01785 [Bacteroidetes bacterium]|nr:hypothetical protein [Bacteroidota bacterium]
MAETQTKTDKRDMTPVTLEARGNIPISKLIKAGCNISPAILQEWDRHPGAKRITKGQEIRVEKYIADELLKLKIKSLDPRHRHKTISAFVPATDY